MIETGKEIAKDYFIENITYKETLGRELAE